MRGAIYLTNNILDERIFNAVLARLRPLTKDMEVVSVSHKPVDFGKNIVVDLPSHAISVLKQMLIGVENIEADLLYILEHDVLYHESYFKRIRVENTSFLYNRNVWQVDRTGEAIYRRSARTSQLIVHKSVLQEYLNNVLRIIRKRHCYEQFGIAPMTHEIRGIKYQGLRMWTSDFPNIDLRHEDNLSKYEYEDKDIRADGVPGWGKTLGRFDELLYE